jgi:hypothetical protein
MTHPRSGIAAPPQERMASSPVEPVLRPSLDRIVSLAKDAVHQ